ncbi:hypothetical protein F0562_000098 [Nyssa sinensis]|uniref:GTD-binding domain-containing protein n=1 Tax=Nyssa sinensis TaxID=561372 RepID=A0A5J5C0J5_9ASTE|nr:hypothetical protein F0562_000098 [Nyssa sinensis]
MACQFMHSWTFSGLVGAFLDLAISYFLLCASTLAFLTSKFLGIFGLCLPCPCEGLICNPNGSYCLHRLLVDYPTEKVSSVQLSVKSKFPFDSICARDHNCELNLTLVRERNNNVDRFVEMEDEGSCSLISDARKSQNLVGRDSVQGNELGLGFGVVNSSNFKEGRFDLKGKGIMNQRPRGGLRRRRKGVANYGQFWYISSYDPSCADVQGVPWSPSGINNEGNEAVEGSLVPVDFGGVANGFHSHSEDAARTVTSSGERDSHGYELNEPLGKSEPEDKNASSSDEELKSNAQGELGFDDNERNAIRVLEQALEEEHTARAALYLELEKERSAAATAADEAMAMILRLQEEKASIEMEARQYQRIIEEKSAYDAEEMNILKEILVRREREKHFLEKDLESFRQMIYLGNEQSEGDAQDIVETQRPQLATSLDLSEDPVLMLHQLSDYIDKKEIVKNKCSNNGVTSADKQNHTLALGKELPIPAWEEDVDSSKQQDLEEQFSHVPRYGNDGNHDKGMVSMDNNPYKQQKESHRFETFSKSYKSNSSEENILLEKTIPLVGEEQEQNDNTKPCQGMVTKAIKTHNGTELYFPYDGENVEQHEKEACQGSKDPHNLIFDMEPRVHDVHVIDNESNLCNEVSGDKSGPLLLKDTSNVHKKSDLPSKASDIQRIDVSSD